MSNVYNDIDNSITVGGIYDGTNGGIQIKAKDASAVDPAPILIQSDSWGGSVTLDAKGMYANANINATGINSTVNISTSGTYDDNNANSTYEFGRNNFV